jgi:hypothetical protein
MSGDCHSKTFCVLIILLFCILHNYYHDDDGGDDDDDVFLITVFFSVHYKHLNFSLSFNMFQTLAQQQILEI